MTGNHHWFAIIPILTKTRWPCSEPPNTSQKPISASFLDKHRFFLHQVHSHLSRSVALAKKLHPECKKSNQNTSFTSRAITLQGRSARYAVWALAKTRPDAGATPYISVLCLTSIVFRKDMTRDPSLLSELRAVEEYFTCCRGECLSKMSFSSNAASATVPKNDSCRKANDMFWLPCEWTFVVLQGLIVPAQGARQHHCVQDRNAPT